MVVGYKMWWQWKRLDLNIEEKANVTVITLRRFFENFIDFGDTLHLKDGMAL